MSLRVPQTLVAHR